MKKLFVLSLLSVASIAHAETDLTLPGEKWIAQFNKYICSETGPAVEAPAALAERGFVFEQITTDATLDNVLLKATFNEAGVSCRYNAILFADNATRQSRLVESKAYAPAADGACAEGKALLDAALASADYLYYGHPHNVALLLPKVGGESVCEGAETVGVNFVVRGRIAPRP